MNRLKRLTRYWWVLLLGVSMTAVTACSTSSSFRTTPQSGTSGLIDSLTRPLTSGTEATTGPVMFVGALTIFIGVVALWGFKKVSSGIGMIFTGFIISLLALWLRDYAGVFLLVSVLLGIGYGVYLLTDYDKRRKLKKRAKQLWAEGRSAEAETLDKEADS